MHKIGLIISREYLTRVRKKSFIVMTILGPLLFAAFLLIPAYLSTVETEVKTIEVLDESGLFADKFESGGNIEFVYVQTSLEEAKDYIPAGKHYGLLYIPPITLDSPGGITLFTETSPGFGIVRNVERSVKTTIEDLKLERSGIDKEVLDGIKTDVSLNTISIGGDAEKAGSAEVASIIGYLGSFLIYFFVFLYGAQVMRGVAEEKNSRIVEVIISTVKPFQLMVGKIMGIAAVGLTQFLLWVTLTAAISSAIFAFTGQNNLSSIASVDESLMDETVTEEVAEAGGQDPMIMIKNALDTINFPLIIGGFIIYFLGGYLLYAALFAAVGSAVDSDADTQQFMFPISMPLILSIMVLGLVLKDPDGSWAFWLSMIPFTSPVVMMMRLPFGVDLWQLALSIAFLVAGFLGTSWMAARIYRIGILMHGTKINYRTLAKWMTMKQ